MVNSAQQFLNAVGSGQATDKAYWDNLKKLGAPLEKVGIAELDKLFDAIANRQPLEAGPLFYVLGAKLKKELQSPDAATRLIAQVQFAMQSVTHEELGLMYEKCYAVLDQFTQTLLNHKLAIHGIRIMQSAVDKLSKGVKGIITQAHSYLFCLCLTAKRLDPAIPYLEIDAGACFSNASELYRLTCENALLLFYYGGLVKLGLKNFQGAAQSFEMCVCMPAVTASGIILESLKKLILLNILLGRSQQLPSYRSSSAQRLAQIKCPRYYSINSIYNEMVEAKPNSKPASLNRFTQQLDKFATELHRDNNFGLSYEVYNHAIDTNIEKLPDAFSRLQIDKIKKFCRIDDAQYDVRHALEKFLGSGKVEGKISAREGTVSFTPIARSEEADQEALDRAAVSSSDLDDLLRRCHDLVDQHPTLVARKDKKTAGMSVGLGSLLSFT